MQVSIFKWLSWRASNRKHGDNPLGLELHYLRHPFGWRKNGSTHLHTPFHFNKASTAAHMFVLQNQHVNFRLLKSFQECDLKHAPTSSLQRHAQWPPSAWHWWRTGQPLSCGARDQAGGVGSFGSNSATKMGPGYLGGTSSHVQEPRCHMFVYVCCGYGFLDSIIYSRMGLSINWGIPKSWMVYHGKSWSGWFRGTPTLGNFMKLPYLISLRNKNHGIVPLPAIQWHPEARCRTFLARAMSNFCAKGTRSSSSSTPRSPLAAGYNPLSIQKTGRYPMRIRDIMSIISIHVVSFPPSVSS